MTKRVIWSDNMLIMFDMDENVILHVLERKEEHDQALKEAFKIEERAKGTSLEGKLKHAIKYIWELM